ACGTAGANACRWSKAIDKSHAPHRPAPCGGYTEKASPGLPLGVALRSSRSVETSALTAARIRHILMAATDATAASDIAAMATTISAPLPLGTRRLTRRRAGPAAGSSLNAISANTAGITPHADRSQ